MIIEKNALRYFKSAKALFLPVKPLELINGFELKLGRHHYLFCNNETPFNNSSSAQIAEDKYCTNKLLEKAGVPVPKAVSLHISEFEPEQLEEQIAELKFPLVIKPIDGSLGTDVLCNIQTLKELKKFVTHYFLSNNHLQIEEFHGKLKSYRVLVFNRKVIGVVLRYPSSVIGDGIHTLTELINLTNITRQKINEFIGPIAIDDECKIKLRELGIEPSYIPHPHERVVLGYTSNASRGGSNKSLKNQICKKNRRLMVHVADLLHLNLTGIDIECTDIMTPLTESNGVVIEVNHRPSIRMHELPLQGTPHLVTRKIMRSFIYRHPVAYLYSLYSNKPSAFYIRAFIIAFLTGFTYLLINCK